MPALNELWSPESRIIGVPSLGRNIRKRGFDQVSQIISALPSKFRQAYIPKLLQRQDGLAQKTLSRLERSHNLSGKIILRPGMEVPAQVLLIDDVCTTGASLSVCAHVLQSSGCKDICALTVFRD